MTGTTVMKEFMYENCSKRTVTQYKKKIRPLNIYRFLHLTRYENFIFMHNAKISGAGIVIAIFIY